MPRSESFAFRGRSVGLRPTERHNHNSFQTNGGQNDRTGFVEIRSIGSSQMSAFWVAYYADYGENIRKSAFQRGKTYFIDQL